mmetsp:Transcript_36251/g.91529  ORF Transcript_36251/g.91529 Transcript_36251/m.91529 type:complete len:202 (+) Transcript_36251:1276-1881(+)
MGMTYSQGARFMGPENATREGGWNPFPTHTQGVSCSSSAATSIWLASSADSAAYSVGTAAANAWHSAVFSTSGCMEPSSRSCVASRLPPKGVDHPSASAMAPVRTSPEVRCREAEASHMSAAGRHRRGGATRAEVKASGQGNPPTGGSVSTGHQLIMANSAHISSAVPQLLSCLKTLDSILPSCLAGCRNACWMRFHSVSR